MTKDMKQYWKPTLWHSDHATKLKSLNGIVGSSASIWGDSVATISDKKFISRLPIYQRISGSGPKAGLNEGDRTAA